MTFPLYLHDSYLKEMTASIVEVIPEGNLRWQVVLDRTIFYPMGGGQPTDQGIIATEEWEGKVYQVLQKGDKIVHYVESNEPPLSGSQIRGKIDWDRRFLHMRLHSAGHIVDFALHLLGYSPTHLVPLKGDHGKKPYIIYQGTVEEDFREALERKANELVENNLSLSFRFADYKELEQEVMYLQPGLPSNKPLRLLTLEGIGSVADGGTQVHSTSEIGHITILPIEKKDSTTHVHYRLT